MALKHLELYQGKLPRKLESLPGAQAYDTNDASLYWAVLMPEPAPGSALADFFAPEGPSSSATAISHGNDTVDANAQTAPISRAGIWRPKYPPYGFKITSPNGVELELDPPGAGGEAVIHFVAHSAADGLGIWLVRVFQKNVSLLPAAIDDRRAVLNPDDQDFAVADFLHQPLLILDTRGVPTDGGSCPTFNGEVTVSGCAPGQVSFTADVSGDTADVEEVVWEFGDGEIDEQFDPPFVFPLTTTHNYAAEPGDTVRVSVRRGAGCTPRTINTEAEVLSCTAPSCTSIRSLEVRNGCVPGQVEFRMLLSGASSDVQEITWTWGDGRVSSFDAENLEEGLNPSHYYVDVPPADASVAIRLNDSCRPSVASATVDLPICPGAPRCPTLDGIDVEGCAGNGREVTLMAIGENLGRAESFRWDFGDGSTTTGGATVTHEYGERVERTVALTVISPRGCVPRRQTQTRTVPACRNDDDGAGGDGGDGRASLSCIILFILFWVALFLTLILLMTASCTLNPAAIGLAIGVGLGTFLLLALWLFICGPSACGLLVLTINILSVLAIVWPVITAILTLAMPCVLIGGLIGEGFVGTILGIAVIVAQGLGCLVQPNGLQIAGRFARSAASNNTKRLSLMRILASRCEGCRRRAGW